MMPLVIGAPSPLVTPIPRLGCYRPVCEVPVLPSPTSHQKSFQ